MAVKAGDTYKNYKDLCSALGIEPKAGDQKKKQLQEIERILKYRRYGNAYIIEKVYDKPKADLASLSSTPAKKKKEKHPLYYHFSNYVQTILMQYLVYSTTDGKINVSMTTLCKIVGLLGKNYDSYSTMAEFTEKNPEISSTEIRLVKNKAYQKVYSIVNYSLQRLRAKRLIDYQRIYVFKDKDKKYKTATDEETQKILDIEHEALKELKLQTINQVYIRGLMKEYSDRNNRKLEELYSWTNVRREFHILYLPESMVEEIKRLSLIAAKKEVNQNLISYLREHTAEENRKRYPHCHLTIATPELQEEFEKNLKPEDALNKYPLWDCMRHFDLIAEAFVEYIEDDDEYECS